MRLNRMNQLEEKIDWLVRVMKLCLRQYESRVPDYPSEAHRLLNEAPVTRVEAMEHDLDDEIEQH